MDFDAKVCDICYSLVERIDISRHKLWHISLEPPTHKINKNRIVVIK